ncbi:MAG: PAS domain-containing protein [Thermodesulfobacteria bacterium]|nr:PAS domain-containing protein [Thermodesulfobacteriota bacterium]
MEDYKIFAGMKDALALVEGDRLVYANQAFKKLFRLGEEIPPLRELFDHPPQEYGLFELVANRLDGTNFEAEVIKLPYRDDVSQLLVRDVSERRATEKMWLQAERLTAMGKLAGEIAHEINNPLGGIMLYGNLLKEDLPAESPLLEYVDKIIKLATRCRIIAKALLNFGRPEDGLEEWVDVNRVLQDMFSLIADHRLFRGIDVRWELTEGLPLVQGNRSQLEQVVLNLIINAGEAMEGRGVLTLRTYASEDEMVIFEVEDTGPGIPPELVSRIFEPFFTTKTGGKGTGLGLAICHGIVKRHGGKIEVESKPGEGALFRVKLPRLHYETHE